MSRAHLSRSLTISSKPVHCRNLVDHVRLKFDHTVLREDFWVTENI